MNYFLEATGDTRDRAAEIEQRLQEQGVCILGAGDYYVSGIKMPRGTSLLGLGEPSKLILAEGVDEGYAVILDTHCTLKNLTLLGDATDPTERPAQMGTRHGIGFLGDATKENWRGRPQTQNCIVSGCRIRNFSGGGITMRGTGYSVLSSACVSDCRIQYCGAGIYIPHWSEYHKFNNVVCHRNFYGCVNNGGNNVFTGCAFDANVLGFLMDNGDGKAINNSHGSAVGCTFNHTDDNQGIGIHIINNTAGFVFTGCQVFYSKTVVEHSKGIQFNNMNYGKNEEITVKGEGLVLFSHCAFTNAPTVLREEAPHLRFNQCYTRSGEALFHSERKQEC